MKKQRASDEISRMIRVKVNGGERNLREGIRLSDLLADIGIPAEGTAAAVNHAVIPKQEYDRTNLAEGDEIEIIHAVGGGADGGRITGGRR